MSTTKQKAKIMKTCPDTAFGRNIAYERLANESMAPNRYVSIDHDYYSSNPEAARYKNNEALAEIDDNMGYSGGYKYNNPRKNAGEQSSEEWARHSKSSDDKRLRRAIGGTAKVRRYEYD